MQCVDNLVVLIINKEILFSRLLGLHENQHGIRVKTLKGARFTPRQDFVADEICFGGWGSICEIKKNIY
jgi:hypothetical protein